MTHFGIDPGGLEMEAVTLTVNVPQPDFVLGEPVTWDGRRYVVTAVMHHEASEDDIRHGLAAEGEFVVTYTLTREID